MAKAVDNAIEAYRKAAYVVRELGGTISYDYALEQLKDLAGSYEAISQLEQRELDATVQFFRFIVNEDNLRRGIKN